MPQAAPGEWYIAVVCKRCNHRVFLFRDMNEGKSDLGKTEFLITCPNCNKPGSYQAEHYQKPPVLQDIQIST
jgi:hypothetical protein